MQLTRCSGCLDRPPVRPTQVTWAWRRADGVRTSWRSNLCVGCFASKVAPFDIEYTAEQRLTCPGCGIDTEDDHDIMYTTSFVPGYGPLRLEAPFCGACAAHLRIWIQEHAQQLEEGSGAAGSPRQAFAGDDTWAALGLRPRD